PVQPSFANITACISITATQARDELRTQVMAGRFFRRPRRDVLTLQIVEGLLGFTERVLRGRTPNTNSTQHLEISRIRLAGRLVNKTLSREGDHALREIFGRLHA